MAASAVQHRSSTNTNVTSIALAFASNNTAGNLLVYCSGSGVSGITLSACTDSNTNTIANAIANAGNVTAGQSRIDYVANSHSGANTVTAHVSPSDDLHVHIWEIAGCVTSSPVRATGTVAGSSTASVSTSTTTPQSGDAVIGFFFDNPASDTLTAGTGYSPSELTTSAGGDSALSEFKAATASGTQTATCGGNSTSQLDQDIVVFIAAAGAAASNIPQLGMMGVGF